MFKMKQTKSWKEKIKKYVPRPNLLKFRFIFTKSIKRELMRKSIHLSSLWIPVFIYFANERAAFALFSLMLLVNMLLEFGNYKRWTWVRATYGKLFFKMLRTKESKKTNFEVSGSMYVLLSAMICVAVFSKEVAAVSLSIMLISDTFAAVFGKIYGIRKLRAKKSMEGTIAFFISSLIVVLACNPLLAVNYASIIACFAATFAEVFDDKIKIDDNLSIPIAVGLILTFI
ncbi:MAG: SEC59/DGK1/VTE5 family protein [Lactobacillaceae bacterium]|jgi:dolichol kinase|nr:SEC59/DGK1/VTE5 family protein [Lactobacillaceae bacterium]